MALLTILLSIMKTPKRSKCDRRLRYEARLLSAEERSSPT
jgi:hypothetical protein